MSHRWASSNATQWRWESGEPITYANWLPDYIFGESLDISERVYAVMMTFNDGKWYAVGPDSLVWRMTEMAILEKADMFDGSSPKKNDSSESILILCLIIIL